MVLFLAKSTACIGIVAAVASGVSFGDLAPALGRSARAAAEGAGQACLRSDPCLRAGVGALATAAGTPATRPARSERPISQAARAAAGA